MMGQGAAQFDRAVIARVMRPAGLQAVYAGLDRLLRSGEVRLPYSKTDDVGHRGRDVEEAADARARNFVNASRQDACRKRGPLGLELGGEQGRVRGESVGLGGRSH